MLKTIVLPIQYDEIRDIHNTGTQFKNEIKLLQKETNKVNFRDWIFYEEWMISQGRLRKTILKHIYNFRSFLKLYPTKNLKTLSQKQIIDATYNIMISKYADRTKKDLQIFLKQYLHLFANTTKRHYMIDHFIKIIQTSDVKVPDHLISHNDFEKIINYLEKPEHKLMVKILYSTGMRITELFNIKHTQATAPFRQYSDQQVYKVMNWSPNSKMAKVYSNLNDQDIINTMKDFKKSQKEDD